MHKEENEGKHQNSVLDLSAQKESHSKQKRHKFSAAYLCSVSVAPWNHSL